MLNNHMYPNDVAVCGERGGELEWEKSYMYYAGPDCREGQQENIYN